MRSLYDSTNSADLPAGAAMVGGYIDGRYRWSDDDWARFPNAVKVRIAALPSTDDGHVLDVENGDATPTQAPPWVAMRRAAGVDPSVYVSASEWPAVRAAFAAAGIPEPHYWIAQWDNRAELIAGAVAKQYANPDLTGGHYDASVVADFWPGVDAPMISKVPQYAGESVPVLPAVVGEVVVFEAFYDFGKGPRAIVRKVLATRPGMWPFTIYPPVDPDADETMVADAQPAYFIVAARAKA